MICVYLYRAERLVCSDSLGRISIIQEDKVVESWSAHDYEAWISAFYYWNPYIVWTGITLSLNMNFFCSNGIGDRRAVYYICIIPYCI